MTIRQVARLAGVDPGTVRHYFPAKDDLVHAAIGADAELIEAYRRIAGEVAGKGAERAGAALVAAAVSSLYEEPVAGVAISACLTGADYESTVLAAFDREVVTPVAHELGSDHGEEWSAIVMSAFLGFQLLATLLPAAGQSLRNADVQAILAESIGVHLRPV
jgi:AcrR family transcriptional regulator